MMDYSTKKISSQLVEEIKTALQSIGYGSIEIYVSDSKVTQITTRSIKKTSIEVQSELSSQRTAATETKKTSSTTTKSNDYTRNILNIRTSLSKQG